MSKKEEKNGADQSASISENLLHEQLCTFINKVSVHAILLVDINGIIKSWNRGAEQIFGYTPTEVLGLPCDRLFSESSNDVPFVAILKTASDQESLTHERWAYHKNNNRFWVSIEVAAIASEKKQTPIFGLIIHDLSKRKQVEDDLRASQEKLRTILEAIPTPVFVKDMNLRYTECNAAFEKYIGLTREQLIGPSLFELFEKSKAEVYQKADLELLQSNKPQIYESLVRFNDGSDHNVVFRKSIYTDELGEKQGIVGLIEDITDRIKDEEDLSKITRVYQLILDNSTLGIALVRNRIFEWANKRVGELLLVPIEKLQGASLRSIYPSDKVYEQLEKEAYPLLERGVRYETTIQLQRSDGTLFWCRFIGKAINPTDPKEGSIWMFEDITDRKRGEEKLSRITRVYQLILDNSTLGISLVRNRVFEWTNNRLAEMLLIPIEMLQGAPTRLIYPSDAPYEHLGQEAYPLLNKGERYEDTLQLQQSDGSLFWCRFIGKAINPADPKEGSIWMFEDITDRKRDEEKLSRITRVYQLILDNSTLGISLVRNRVFEWTNNRLAEMLLIPIEMLQGAPTRLIYPSDAPYEHLGQEAYPLLNKGERYEDTLQLQRSDGSLFWCRFIGKAINPADPKEGSIWMFEDITERQQIEKALKHSRASLQALIENTDESIWSIDKRYRITTYNSRFKQMVLDLLGLTVDIGSNIKNLPEPFKSTWKDRLAMVLQGEKYSTIDRMVVNYNIVYIEVMLHPIMVDDQVTGVTCFSRDITQRKLAEEALQKSQSQLSLAMGLSMMCTWEYNVETELFHFDDQFHSIYGDSALEQAGQLTINEYVQRFIYPDDKTIVPFEISKALNSTLPQFFNQYEHRIMRTDGEIRHVVVSYTTIRDQAGKISKLLGAIQDITERKKIEIKLEELNASKDKFFSIIAHDLKNPFNSLIGYSELLKEKIIENKYSELNIYAESLYNVSTQTYNLLENLLEWANSQRGGMKYNPREINLQSQVAEVVQLLTEVADQKSISISVDISDEITVLADKNMLKTILRNLISNAIKFTFINGKIALTAAISNSMALVSVSDNGTGMSHESVGKLFALASNVSTLGTSKEKGTGLGLLLCKDFVEKHGGTIWVESEQGKGSVFRFTLPIMGSK